MLKPTIGLVGLSLLIGCASRPENIDFDSMSPLTSQTAANDPSVFQQEVRVAYPKSTAEMVQLRQQLTNGPVGSRVEVCKRLGEIAANNEGNVESVELLTQAMQHDASMDVRTAATNSLGGLERAAGDHELDSLVRRQPISEDTDSPIRIGRMISNLWR